MSTVPFLNCKRKKNRKGRKFDNKTKVFSTPLRIEPLITKWALHPTTARFSSSFLENMTSVEKGITFSFFSTALQIPCFLRDDVSGSTTSSRWVLLLFSAALLMFSDTGDTFVP